MLFKNIKPYTVFYFHNHLMVKLGQTAVIKEEERVEPVNVFNMTERSLDYLDGSSRCVPISMEDEEDFTVDHDENIIASVKPT